MSRIPICGSTVHLVLEPNSLAAKLGLEHKRRCEEDSSSRHSRPRYLLRELRVRLARFSRHLEARRQIVPKRDLTTPKICRLRSRIRNEMAHGGDPEMGVTRSHVKLSSEFKRRVAER